MSPLKFMEGSTEKIKVKAYSVIVSLTCLQFRGNQMTDDGASTTNTLYSRHSSKKVHRQWSHAMVDECECSHLSARRAA